jgi:hypothetical protein
VTLVPFIGKNGCGTIADRYLNLVSGIVIFPE